jgi:hypothetical protein
MLETTLCTAGTLDGTMQYRSARKIISAIPNRIQPAIFHEITIFIFLRRREKKNI